MLIRVIILKVHHIPSCSSSRGMLVHLMPAFGKQTA